MPRWRNHAQWQQHQNQQIVINRYEGSQTTVVHTCRQALPRGHEKKKKRAVCIKSTVVADAEKHHYERQLQRSSVRVFVLFCFFGFCTGIVRFNWENPKSWMSWISQVTGTANPTVNNPKCLSPLRTGILSTSHQLPTVSY